MTSPPLEAVVAAGDAVPSIALAALRVAGALAFVVACGWAVLRWRRSMGKLGGGLRVLDRAFLTRGASIAVVAVEGRRLLLGVSAEGVRLLTDLEDDKSAFPELLAQRTESNAR